MIKIGIIGPESTGKSTLAKALAAHFGGTYVAEYARTYVEQLARPYTYEDVEQIAQEQIRQLQQPYDTEYVFFDTDLIITKVWFEYCYHHCPDYVTEALEHENIDLYLVCLPDLPFEDDPVREHPHEREELLGWYLQEVKALGRPYTLIGGIGEERTNAAVAAIGQLH